MILNIPLPQILKIITVASAIRANGQLVEALEIAEGARLSQIQMMIGPVTTGGRKRITRRTPMTLMIRERIR